LREDVDAITGGMHDNSNDGSTPSGGGEDRVLIDLRLFKGNTFFDSTVTASVPIFGSMLEKNKVLKTRADAVP
jgi:hypothetical protein